MKLLIGLFLISVTLIAGCGGGGSNPAVGSGGGGGGTPPTTPPTPAPPADRYVVSGNSDGTLSILRDNKIAGYPTVVGYFNAGTGSGINDIFYDAGNSRIILITSSQLVILSFDSATGAIAQLDSRPTSGNSSHLSLNSVGTAVYIASGTSTNQNIDTFTISATGTLSPAVSTAVTIDSDYIKLNPDGSRLYLVSRSDNQVLVFDINTDTSLAGSPLVINAASNPTSIGFNQTGTTAYLTRINNTDNLVVYSVAADGNLNQTASFTQSNTPIDMVLSANGSHLYVLESSNKRVYHYSVDSSGSLTSVAFINVSFTATDLALSLTGAVLNVGHSEDDMISSIKVDLTDGTLSTVNSVRAYDSVNTITTIGGLGSLQATSRYLLAPDQTGLYRFAIASNGSLTAETTEDSASALIDGEVAVNYSKGLLIGAGENAVDADLLTSYQYSLTTGAATLVSNIEPTVSAAPSGFVRVELGRSGRFMYVLEKVKDVNLNGSIRTYAYATDGTITPTAINSRVADKGPENLSLHPAGRFIYSINSFDDTISRFEINETDGSLSGGTQYTPGNTGSGAGRPIDLRFHPNGRFGYVTLQDDAQIVRYTIRDNGILDNIVRTNLPQNGGTNVEPGPIAIHPNGLFMYVGERNLAKGISLLTINSSDFSLTHQSRIAVTENPTWISIDPQGGFLYVRYTNESIQVFGIDQATGELTDTQQVVVAGNKGGFLPSMTIVAPLL